MSKVKDVIIVISREVGYNDVDYNKEDKFKVLADTLGIPEQEAVDNWKWVSGSNGPVGAPEEKRRVQTDTFRKDVRTNREKIDDVIAKAFPNALGRFYGDDDFEVAAIEDQYGNMWRVWADGDTQKYVSA